jgi:DNA-directed RNA polymerase subunit H (RpoH/RPB5)
MMIDRGYDVPPSLLTVTIDIFDPTQHLEMADITDKDDNNVFVKMFYDAMKPADMKSEVKQFLTESGVDIDKDIEELSPEDKLHLIIVYDPLGGSATTPYKFETEHIGHPFIEVFDVHKLFINPTKHIYQAKWRLMKDKEITELLRRYEAGMTQTTRIILPSVCIDDPMNRYYFGKIPSKDYRGDVYEIIRDGVSISYRKVCTRRMNAKNERK